VEFHQVDVFADAPFKGNPLAVFPDAADLSASQMQSIASEMSLSETTFVLEAGRDFYDVRIFTPIEEIPFAGHPTLGTAWVLRDLGRVKGEVINQRSKAGSTVVRAAGDKLWFERSGEASGDVEDRDPDAARKLAAALGLQTSDIGLEARELGRPGRLRPAFSDAGLRQLMIPLRNVAALTRCRVREDLLGEITTMGAYCFTAVQAGRIRARGFFPSLRVPEDPATGSAAAALGFYLADRISDIRAEILQGQEIGRPSRILLHVQSGKVRVGGQCVPVATGRLRQLPSV
jgi:trans-2,3-dihydro-3-hydroxyanthranilate isomerase